jgi:hypothetical protein
MDAYSLVVLTLVAMVCMACLVAFLAIMTTTLLTECRQLRNELRYARRMLNHINGTLEETTPIIPKVTIKNKNH